MATNPRNDPLIVKRADVARVLAERIATINAINQTSEGGHGHKNGNQNAIEPLTGIQSVSNDIGIAARRLWVALNGEKSRYTGKTPDHMALSTADRYLTAIGEHYRLATGEIPIYDRATGELVA